jgi:hypothetical protein
MQIFYVKFYIKNINALWSIFSHTLITYDPSNDKTKVNKKKHISK